MAAAVKLRRLLESLHRDEGRGGLVNRNKPEQQYLVTKSLCPGIKTLLTVFMSSDL